MSDWFKFFDLDKLASFFAIYDAHVKDGLTNIRIIRPPSVSIELLDPVCTTPSMKADLINLIKAYTEERSLVDCIFIYADDATSKSMLGGPPDGFIFIKKIMSCIDSKKQTISIDYFCTNKPKRGKVLLSYTIFTSIINSSFLLLQLDNGFSNIAAYCLYTKLGFTVHPYLVPDCYKFSLTLIPMLLQPPESLDGIFAAKIDDLCAPGANAPAVSRTHMRKFLAAVSKTKGFSEKNAAQIAEYIAKAGGSRRARKRTRKTRRNIIY